jgi:hypothetical protein
MPGLNAIRGEIEYLRRQIHRQRREIKDLQRAGIPSRPAEELLDRMLTKVDRLCAERDRLRKEQLVNCPATGNAIQGPMARRVR